MASGVQVAISMSNTGGAWDNAKKYIERATPDSDLQGKGSDIHKVGEPTTSLPSTLSPSRASGRICSLHAVQAERAVGEEQRRKAFSFLVAAACLPACLCCCNCFLLRVYWGMVR